MSALSWEKDKVTATKSTRGHGYQGCYFCHILEIPWSPHNGSIGAHSGTWEIFSWPSCLKLAKASREKCRAAAVQYGFVREKGPAEPQMGSFLHICTSHVEAVAFTDISHTSGDICLWHRALPRCAGLQNPRIYEIGVFLKVILPSRL